MGDNQVALVVVLIFFIVVGVNALVYASLSRKHTVGEIELMRKAAKRVRDPWEQEAQDLKELKERVEQLIAEGKVESIFDKEADIH